MLNYLRGNVKKKKTRITAGRERRPSSSHGNENSFKKKTEEKRLGHRRTKGTRDGPTFGANAGGHAQRFDNFSGTWTEGEGKVLCQKRPAGNRKWGVRSRPTQQIDRKAKNRQATSDLLMKRVHGKELIGEEGNGPWRRKRVTGKSVLKNSKNNKRRWTVGQGALLLDEWCERTSKGRGRRRVFVQKEPPGDFCSRKIVWTRKSHENQKKKESTAPPWNSKDHVVTASRGSGGGELPLVIFEKTRP